MTATTAASPSQSTEPIPTFAVSALPSSSTTAAPTAAPPPSLAREREAPRTDLRRERELVDAARAALARGNASEALGLLERHAATFPAGQLAEERDVLRVQSLVAAGRRGDAEAHANAFKRAHPNSPFLPAVDAALEK